jgi:predicted ribosome quality control (RQC) complex YloA/Tae2 family protein
MKSFTFNKTLFSLGTNAQENWKLLSIAEKHEYWAHLADIPSAHVILHLDVPPIDEELEYAQQLLFEQTKKAPKHAKMIYTVVSNLRRGSVPGEVIVCNEKKLKYWGES